MTGLPKYTVRIQNVWLDDSRCRKGLSQGSVALIVLMRELFSKFMNADCIEYFHNLIIQLIDWQQGNLSHLQMIL